MTATLLQNARRAGRFDGLVDVLLDDGRITAVVPAGAAPSSSSTTTRQAVDLDGRVLVPGLWDAHTHLTQWALVRHRLDVSEATSPAHAAALVRARVHGATTPTPQGQPLVGYGFRWAGWDTEPTAAALDEAVGDVPVILLSGDLHSAWASTAGLRYLGIHHHPTGLLREEEWMAASPRIVTVDDDVADELVVDAARAAAERGVVGIVDFELADNLTDWRRRLARGWGGLRVRAGVWEQYLGEVLEAGLADDDPLDGAAGGLVTQGPLKVISDGSLNTLTAFCFDAYAGATGEDAHGILNIATDQLAPLMSRAHEAGLRCAIHAIGDHANALALDAFAAAGARGSIEHAQLLRADDVARFAALGVTASVQPEHAMDDRDIAEDLWPDRTARAFPLADLRRAGVPLALGSDAPVARLDPWVAVAAAVTRSRDGREPWHPEQSLDLRTALEASVDRRSLDLDVGGPADLAVVDVDPFAVDPDGLREMPVAGTLVAGQWTHRAF